MTEQVIRNALSNLNSDRPVTGYGNLYTTVYYPSFALYLG